MNNYFIKEGYVCNTVKSFDEEIGDRYWTKERLESSLRLQYHVYELAYKIFLKNGCKTLLDIGCGPGTKLTHFFSNLSPEFELNLIDQPSMKDYLEKQFPEAKIFSANLENADFSAGSKFDMIICSDVIEHLANPDSLLEIIRNHLTEDGIAVISTPDRDMRRGKDNFQSPNTHHVREWNFEEFEHYIESKEFKIVDHINVPNVQLNIYDSIIYRFLYKKINKRSWYPVQIIIARR